MPGVKRRPPAGPSRRKARPTAASHVPAGGGRPGLRSGQQGGLGLRNAGFVGLLCLGLWPSLLAAPSVGRWWRPARPAQLPDMHRIAATTQEPSSHSLPALPAPVALPPIPPAAPPDNGESWPAHSLGATEILTDAASLRAEMARDVTGVALPSRRLTEAVATRAVAMLKQTHRSIEGPQLAVVVDRNPAVERLYLMLARPGGPSGWRALGSVHVSTGQAGRKDYYITPVGVFAHGGAILDFRAQGTYNEHHVRGLGLAGMRVWDFGWQWALKGWHTDGEGGDIRLQMHATDPDLLERRLGRPASEGCVRVSSTMNRFLDRHGILDADYERAAVQDIRYRALLAPDRTPTPLAGRLLIVIDSGLPLDAPPTAASRPANWPSPDLQVSAGAEKSL